MRKITLLFSFTLIWAFSAKAQFSTEVGLNLGASNYLGDIGGQLQTARPWVVDMKMQETRWAVGGYLKQKINSRFYVEAKLDWIRICGADSLSTNYGRVGRNLFFRNDIEELSLMADWIFYQVTDIGGYFSYKTTFNAYLTGGVSVFHDNPQSIYNGQWVDLEPLHTSGVSYSLYQPGIPFGIGFFYIFQRQYRLGWNLIATKTFTHELDDVGLTYVAQPEGTEAAAMANRTVAPGTMTSAGVMTRGWADNYLPGNKRGDPQDQWFVTTQISVGYVIKGSSHKIMHRSIFNYKSRSTF